MGLAPGHDAWIISVGNELLIGRVVNTNLAWLGRKLTLLGFKVRGCITVPDDVEEIAWAFRTAAERGARLILSTGGLGPTFDDKTVEGFARALGARLVLDREALRMVEEKYRAGGYELTEHRIKMATLPEGSKPIPNPVGTAPGVEGKLEEALVFLLPGVPAEMKAMFEEYVEPKLREIGPKVRFAEAYFRAVGIPESEAAPLVERAMKASARAYIKSHPRGTELGAPLLEFHVTASAEESEEARREARRVAELLAKMLAERGARIEWIE